MKNAPEKLQYNPEGRSTEEKLATLRKHRESEFEKLIDAVYERRGWDSNGIPTLEKIQELEIDYPDVVELIRQKT